MFIATEVTILWLHSKKIFWLKKYTTALKSKRNELIVATWTGNIVNWLKLFYCGYIWCGYMGTSHSKLLCCWNIICHCKNHGGLWMWTTSSTLLFFFLWLHTKTVAMLWLQKMYIFWVSSNVLKCLLIKTQAM